LAYVLLELFMLLNTDAGATVKDNNDTGLKATVTITNASGKTVTVAAVGTTAGTYKVTYTAKDKAGNKAASVTRTVVVAPVSITS
jgi:hypothetical protein